MRLFALYAEGIGVIYFDAVNAFTNVVTSEIVLEIATNVTSSAAENGITFESITDNYADADWRPYPFDVFTVDDVTRLTPCSMGVTALTLASVAGSSNQFYRVRAPLNFRNPIRFRIRRVNETGSNPDTTGLILLDNIQASYPAMTVGLNTYGNGYDDSLTGSEVLGSIGDFSIPFLTRNTEQGYPRAWFNFVTNSASSVPLVINNPRFVYRWRYLNQVVADWREIAFDQDAISSATYSTSNLVGSASVQLGNEVGDLEYYFVAEIDAPYYMVQDYACRVGFGEGWTEKISAVTNRAVYNAFERKVPSGGTDYFTRIREGESNLEWVRIVGELSVPNAASGSTEVIRIDSRMTLVGDHQWRCHYEIPKNGVGGTLRFCIVNKEYYTNAMDSATWLVRTNALHTADGEVLGLPYSDVLSSGFTNVLKVVLDDASTHLKIEYNDERQSLVLAHATYQDFNQWTEALNGFVLDGGTSSSKTRYDAPFDDTWNLPSAYNNSHWTETFLPPANAFGGTVLYKWNTVMQMPDSGWTAHNAMYVQSARGDYADMALAIGGNGVGALTTENLNADEQPLGLESVSFTARLSQPVRYEDFATYMDGFACANYAISAKVTMSQDYESPVHVPRDISPVNPSVSLVGYHRGNQGCYEFRMTRVEQQKLKLELYKWTAEDSYPTAVLLKSADYTANMLLPSSMDQVNQYCWTTAYFLVYTLPNGAVRLEGHLAPFRSRIQADISNMMNSVIWFVDEYPGVLARGGSYGVGSADCRAGFGAMQVHDVVTPPTASTDAGINSSGIPITSDQLTYEWNRRGSRWEVANFTLYAASGCLMAVVPTNQAVQVWLSDAKASGTRWIYSGHERTIDSFATNRFTISPKMSGSWKVRLQTKEGVDVGVVLDDVVLTPWEGLNAWNRMDGGSDRVSNFDTNWVFTKGWISNKAGSATIRECLLQPSRGRVGYPMGLRSPYIDEGLSLFSYSYKNADSNCVMLVQIATNMVPRDGTQYVAPTTELAESDSDNGYIWTTVATNDFRTKSASDRASGTLTTFINLRQHNVYDRYSRTTILTNVCGLIRVIVDPAIVKKVVEASPAERSSLENYGKITLTEAHCYNEPALNLKSWFGWNVHTEGWDGAGNAGPYACLTDYPYGHSLALNFSAIQADNASSAAKGIGLAHPELAAEYAQQNPFVQSAALTNGIGTVSFRARLFDPDAPGGCAVVTLYGGIDPGADQPTTESATWVILTNFVVTSSTYQPFEWTCKNTESPYKAVRLSVAGARWGRYPSGLAAAWEWGDVWPKHEPINRVFIDDVSVAEPPSFSIVLSPESGSSFISEADVGEGKSRINVKLSSAPTEPITVKLAIERVFTWSNCTMPVLNTTTLDFAKGQKDGFVYFTDLDGPVEFVLSAVVTTETTNANGIRWCDLFQRDELNFYVVNTSPRIHGEESPDFVRVTIGEPFSISWTAEDVLADATNGMMATWMVDGLVTNIPLGNIMATTFGGTQELVFTSGGSKVARLTLRDKDGSDDTRNFYFDVQPRPTMITIDVDGDAKSFSAEWIGSMMGLSTEWVTSHQALVKSLLEAPSANGRLSVVECYVLGLDPEEMDDFRVTEFALKPDGTLDLNSVKYEPSQEKWNVSGARAVVKGAATLEGPWKAVEGATAAEKAAMRFFKVVVELP